MHRLKMLCAAVLLSPLMFLASCASWNEQTPQQKLDVARVAYVSVVALYDGLCAAPHHPAACTDPKSVAVEIAAKQLIEKAFATAQDAINSNGSVSPEQISTLINTALDAVQIIAGLVEDLKQAPPSPVSTP